MVIISKICKNCNIEFSYNKKERNRKFCTRTCSTAHNNKHRNYDYFKGAKNPSKRLEVRALISQKQKGKKHNWMVGKKNWNYGGLTKEHICKISIAHKGLMAGDKHWNWKGGITNGAYGQKWTKLLRTKIRQRDDFTCKVCNKNGFIVHHIDYNKQNNKEVNLITLCRKCHCKTNYRRNIWYVYFNVVHLGNFNIKNLKDHT